LKEWKVEDRDVPPDPIPQKEMSRKEFPDSKEAEPSAGNEAVHSTMAGSEDVLYLTQNTVEENAEWEYDEDEDSSHERCGECGASMPAFALPAHERFHRLE